MRFEETRDGVTVTLTARDVPPAIAKGLERLGFGRVGATNFKLKFPVETPYLDAIYRNLSEHAPEWGAQKVGHEKVPWRPTLIELLERTKGTGIYWAMCGSSTLALRGIDVEPGDIDLRTDERGAHELAELFKDELIWPLSDWYGWDVGRWFCRAGLAATIEWVGDEKYGPAANPPFEMIEWEGYTFRAESLESQLAGQRLRGATDRVKKIRMHMKNRRRASSAPNGAVG